jgi:hypothetical protein
VLQREPRDAGHGEERRDPHLVKKVGQRGAAVAARISRRVPEQQSTPGEQHAPAGNQNRIQIDDGVIRQRTQS